MAWQRKNTQTHNVQDGSKKKVQKGKRQNKARKQPPEVMLALINKLKASKKWWKNTTASVKSSVR